MLDHIIMSPAYFIQVGVVSHAVVNIHVMGCCCCCCFHPLSDVQQNPAVSTCTEVGDITIVSGVSLRQVKGGCNGLMYIQEDSLYYETRCGSKLCCKFCRYQLKLSQITKVEIVHNETVYSDRGGYINLSPGLKIAAHPSTTVLVAMPDATIFGPQLAQASVREKDKKSDGGEKNDGF